jgi:predicted DNA-binding protein
MGKYKENTKYNVVCMRVSEEEKLVLEELMRKSSMTVSGLMREAIQLYTPQLETNIRK